MKDDSPDGEEGDPESRSADGESFEERVQREWQLLQPRPVACCSFPRSGGYLGNNVWLWGRDDATTFPFKCVLGARRR